jgi:hypothetical protein
MRSNFARETLAVEGRKMLQRFSHLVTNTKKLSLYRRDVGDHGDNG